MTNEYNKKVNKLHSIKCCYIKQVLIKNTSIHINQILDNKCYNLSIYAVEVFLQI